MATMADNGNRPLTIENFPPGLRRRLRVLAAQGDTTMRQLLLDAAYAHAGKLEHDAATEDGPAQVDRDRHNLAVARTQSGPPG
jgi:plasmid stability protein